MSKVTRSDNYGCTYRERAERAGRQLDNARMTLKHERRLLKMKEQGVKIK